MPIKNLKFNGFTITEVLIGIFVISIIFVGIFGLAQMLIRVSSNNQNKIQATGIANGEIEQIKNFAYSSVGVEGGFPSGVLASEKTKAINGKTYLIKTKVEYIIDDKDGIALPEDECPNDYKRINVSVFWTQPFAGSIAVSTDIAPSSLAEECAETGGILSVSVFTSAGKMINSPLIEVRNPATGEVVKSATPSTGEHYFSLPAGPYRVSASKSGYSSERTYGIDEVAIPEKSNPAVLENAVIEQGFTIDKVGSFSIQTLAPWVISDFSDSFENNSKIESITDAVVASGKIILDSIEGAYKPIGDAVSAPIEPASLVRWNEFLWKDSKPSNTDVKYQIFYFQDPDWVLIPEADLIGNAIGFSDSPVDLSNLSIAVYNKIKIKAILSTGDFNYTPDISEWAVVWRSSGGTPIPNVVFNIHGKNKIGKDGDENIIYKYNQDIASGADGRKDLPDMEPDIYTFSIKSAGLSLISTEPAPQPIGLSSDANQSVSLYIDSQNSLSITVKNSGTGDPIFSIGCRLYKEGYDATQYTDINGQTIFAPIDAGTYTLDINTAGYSPFSQSVLVSDEKAEIVLLEKIEQ